MPDPVERQALPDRDARRERATDAMASTYSHRGLARMALDLSDKAEALRGENERLQDMVQDWRERATNHELEVGRLRHDALTVYGIVYEQLTAGVVDDHDRIMRATNELAEAGRRFAGPVDEEDRSAV